MPMLCPDLSNVRVYLHRAPVDMRRQRNGLAALVRAVINEDPFGKALFCFIGKGRDKLKILYWNRNGFVKPSTKDPRRGIRTETTVLPVAPLVRP
jgi:transposase